MKKALKILVLSDTHGFFDIDDYQALPQSDILIHCGDFTQDSQLDEIQSFIDLLSTMKDIEKVVIPGNHQFIFDKDKENHQFTAQQIEHQRILLRKSCHFLQFQMVNIKGINILGISQRPSFFDWNFDFMPDNGKEIVQKYRNKVDILITHWPPFGILDQISKKERGGSKGLLRFVNQIKPKIHLFGHIHQGFGFKQINQTKFYNASYLDKTYNPKNKPHIIQFFLSKQEQEK